MATFVILGATLALVAIPALFLLFTIFIPNVVLRFYAMFRASRDPLWVMPWLGRVTRPWAAKVTKPEPLGF